MPVLGEADCQINCTCPSDTHSRFQDGRVNLSAFTAHIFCVPCKREVDMTDLDDSDIEENGSDILVAWHGICPGCGKVYTLEVTEENVDTPTESMPKIESTTKTEAERIASFNRRGIGR